VAPRKMRGLLTFILILALAAPGLALAGVAQRPAVADEEQSETPTIQVIRRISVGEVYPAAGNIIRQPQKAATPKANLSPPVKVPLTVVCPQPVRTTPVRATANRSIPIPNIPGRG
jgi:hypothetical protein